MLNLWKNGNQWKHWQLFDPAWSLFNVHRGSTYEQGISILKECRFTLDDDIILTEINTVNNVHLTKRQIYWTSSLNLNCNLSVRVYIYMYIQYIWLYVCMCINRLYPDQNPLPSGPGFWEEPLDSVIEEDEEDSGSPPAAQREMLGACLHGDQPWPDWEIIPRRQNGGFIMENPSEMDDLGVFPI